MRAAMQVRGQDAKKKPPHQENGAGVRTLKV